MIELDKRLVEFLKKEFNDLSIINADILKFDFNELDNNQSYKIISNLPYSISSKVIFKILKFSNFSEAVLMVQKEMADRITSKVGSRKYNNFTVLLKITSEIERLFDVSNTCFFPKPEVGSTVIRFKRKKDFDFSKFKDLESFLLKCFSQKRKTILNNLKPFYEKEKILKILFKYNIDPTNRPETISHDLFLKLFYEFYEV